MPAPATLTIPEKALPDLEKIAELSDEVFNTILSVLRDQKPTLTTTQLEEQIGQKLEDSVRLNLASVLTPTFVLFTFKEKSGASARELAEAVFKSSAVAKSDKITEPLKEKLKARLEALLSLDNSLGVTAKALDVMTEHEHVFCGARILSDIRPVFCGPTNTATAAVIVHNLQIAYHEGGSHRELYVAMDTDDIATLKKIVERAENKARLLENMLEKCNMQNLKV